METKVQERRKRGILRENGCTKYRMISKRKDCRGGSV